MQVEKVVIIGATSAIACGIAKCVAEERGKLFLVARNAEKLEAVAGDLRVRGARAVHTWIMDANERHRHRQMLMAAAEVLGGIDVVLIAHGTLSDRDTCERDPNQLVQEFETNCLSVITLCSTFASYFAQQRNGCIAVISSVAGERGRQSNYIYGAAKAAVSTYLQGLRNQLYRTGVHVLTVKPGLVDTPMTAHLPKTPLFASPDAVGKQIYRAMHRGTDVLYVPWFWRWIMLALRLIPERVFKRLLL